VSARFGVLEANGTPVFGVPPIKQAKQFQFRQQQPPTEDLPQELASHLGPDADLLAWQK